MAMFGASKRESYDALYPVLNQPADTTALEREQAPGMLQGDLLGAVGTGAYRGLSRGASVAANVATPALRPLAKSMDEIFGTSTDAWLLDEQAKANRALFESKIDPKTNGAAAQVLYGLGDVLTTVVSTGGNPFASGGLYGVTQAGLGMADGLDTATATAKGIIEGLGLGVGVALAPAYGTTLLQKLMSGAAVNVGVGVATRAPVSVLLNARGYPEMAQQYAPLDAASIVTDAVLGAAFGGFYRAPARAVSPDAVPPSTVDAALTANQTKHAEVDVAPGIPTNTQSRQAHAAALNSAVESLVMGRDVNVEALLREAGFTGKRPDFDALRVIADELEKAGAADMVAKVRAIEAEARSRGLVVEEDTLGSVVLSDKPVEPTVAGSALRESSVRIGDEKVPTRLMLVEAADVQATMGKADNQYRDRTRVASEQQIADIAARLDAALLMDAPVMDYGAPVLASDGTVIGGNGRAAAVAKAYKQGGADGYRQALRAEFGDAVDGMRAPMLVRVLQREVDVSKAAILSNEGGGLRMSALEQAKVDAERLGDLRGAEFADDGMADMTTVRAWVANMPQNQRAAIMDADGRLSAEGAKRLQNAVLFRAYGDSSTLSRLVESTDPGSRNIAAALTRAAPAVADARAAIERGDLYPLGIHDDLVAAVEKLDGLRRDGLAVDDWMRQIDAFGDGMTPEARLLVQFMDGNIRASRVMSDALLGYYARLSELGDPKQGSMFEAAQPDKGRMLTLALEGDAPMYGRGTGARSDVADLTTAFRAMFGRDADRLLDAGRIKIVQSVADLPGSGHPADVGGMFWRGESWVVADNTGLSQIRGRVLHEIGEHAGMRDMLGDALYAETLARVEAKVATDPLFQEARALAESRANKPEHVPAETLAYLVENSPEWPLVRRVLAQVRQWVYRATGGRFVDLTQADLQMMAVASLRRYAREGAVADGGDVPWYMTLFHGSPTVFKPEEGAPLGRLRWRFINTGEGAQAFGYGHYLAQQEWIARTRYRDRLVKRKPATMEIEAPDGRKITLTDQNDPAWKIGDRVVHYQMRGEERALADAVAQVDRYGYWRARAVFEAIAKQGRAVGEKSIKELEELIAKREASMPDEASLTKEWERKAVAADRVATQDLRTRIEKVRADFAEDDARIRALDEVTDEATRNLRPDITKLQPEKPKGALYGKFIPDDKWNQMMIWDAPLSAQPENVKAAFAKMGVSEEAPLISDVLKNIGWKIDKAPSGSPAEYRVTYKDGSESFYDNVADAEDAARREWRLSHGLGDTSSMTGEEAYRKLVSDLDSGKDELFDIQIEAGFEVRRRRAPDGMDPADFDYDFSGGFEEIASVMLHEHGVPGHRFLDGETRAKGWDSPDARFNVVLYSDDLGAVAWEARKNDTEWVTANGRARVVKTDDGMNGRFGVEIDGKEIDYELSLEPALRIAERALDGQLYSRNEPDPVEDTTMPAARVLSEQADAEIATAKELSQGFMPAAECAMRVGA